MKSGYLIYFCEGISSVIDSQVIALLKAIHEKNIFKKTYLFLGIRNEKQKNDFLTRKLSPEIKIVLFKTYPNYPVFNFMNRKSIQNALLSQSINLKESIFHTRGELVAWHLSEILDAKYHKNIIPDVRGASVEEIREFYDINKVLKSLKTSNIKKANKNLNKFYKISVVSDSLKAYMVNNYNIDQEKIVVTPCLADTVFRYNQQQRKFIRNELNLSRDDILIVFSRGGAANWQNNDELIVLAEKGLKVLNLSKKEISHKNVLNKFVSYYKVPLFLNAADATIIWRNKSLVNKVASPVKFSEYVCCGLPVIANYFVDMITSYLLKYDCGLLTNTLENIDLNTIKELSQKNRERISEEGILNFGIDTIVNQYLRTYSSINNF